MPAKLFCELCGKEVTFETPISPELKARISLEQFEQLGPCSACKQAHADAIFKQNPKQTRDARAQAAQASANGSLLSLAEIRRLLEADAY
jgi:hypothetical protein